LKGPIEFDNTKNLVKLRILKEVHQVQSYIWRFVLVILFYFVIEFEVKNSLASKVFFSYLEIMVSIWKSINW